MQAKLKKQSADYHNFSNAVGIRAKDNRPKVVSGSSDLYGTRAGRKTIENSLIGTYAIGNNVVDKTYIESDKYRNKFSEFSLISLHNHPTNLLPTGSDFASVGFRRYAEGIVVCHYGTVYVYKVGNKPFTAGVLDKKVEKYCELPYNVDYKEAHERTLNEMSEEYGISWRELK